MKKILLIALLIVSFIALNAQNRALSLYDFEEASAAFTSISATGTALTPSDWDDGVTPAQSIGFDFDYNDAVYTQFTVNTNGTVNLGDAAINEETNDLESDIYVNLLTALWDDLKFLNNGAGEGIFMQLDGASGNQILTIEYYNVSRYNSTGLVSFQVKLYETDNSIEFVYGDMSAAAGWNEFSTTSIGMNADNTGSVEFISLTPDATNGATVSSDTENDAIAPTTLAEIAEGTVYRFAPPATATHPDVAVDAIISPSSDFLTANEQVTIQFSNPGTEVTGGLSFAIAIYNNVTGNMISTIGIDYPDYPIPSSEVIEYTFDNPIDLSANIEYKIQVSSHLDGDVDVFNNIVSKVVKGVNLDELIYSNGPIITAAGEGFEGGDISEVQTSLGMYNYGYNTNTVIGYRNADQFTIPEGEEWLITGLGFYNWQTESDTNSTINHLDFRIYDGLPGEAVSDTIVDYYDINKLSGSKWSGIYRVYDTDPQNFDRPVMLSVASLDGEEQIVLTEGTYWLDFSSGGTMVSGPWVPYITIPGETSTGDAWHLGFDGWVPWTEDGTSTPQGMPFMLYGSKINDITYPDIAVDAIITPKSNFLTNSEQVTVQLSNPGIEITEGLTFSLEIYNNETGSIIGTTIWEDYTDYPIPSLEVLEYTFDTAIDLSANLEYNIMITAQVDGDIDIYNNMESKIVKGVVLDGLIYNNGSIITAEGEGFEGADISEVQTSLNMYNYGYNTNSVIGYRNADQFTIPEGEEWLITGLGFYNWETTSDTNSTINHLDFRIYDGLPGEVASDTLVDYYDINKLSGSKWSGIYRVYDTDLQNTDRPVMLSIAYLGTEEQIVLTEGTYWLDFSSSGTLFYGPWVPCITELGSITTGDAWHLGFDGWTPWSEDGTSTPQGMPFMLYGSKINGIAGVKKNELSIYPNPGNGVYQIDGLSTGTVEVFDFSGKLVKNINLVNDNELNLTNLSSGVYVVVLKSDKQIQTAKIIQY